MKNDNYISWTEYFMSLAVLSSKRSKDPKTQVGACIVDNKTNKVVSLGYNGFPRGCSDDIYPWDKIHGDDYNSKYMYVVHAEMNAILNYRGSRKDLEGAKIYVDLFPCNECAKMIIQSGIKEVIYLSDKYANSENNIASRKLLDTCKVTYKKMHIDDEMKNIEIKL